MFANIFQKVIVRIFRVRPCLVAIALSYTPVFHQPLEVGLLFLILSPPANTLSRDIKIHAANFWGHVREATL